MKVGAVKAHHSKDTAEKIPNRFEPYAKGEVLLSFYKLTTAPTFFRDFILFAKDIKAPMQKTKPGLLIPRISEKST